MNDNDILNRILQEDSDDEDEYKRDRNTVENELFGDLLEKRGDSEEEGDLHQMTLNDTGGDNGGYKYSIADKYSPKKTDDQSYNFSAYQEYKPKKSQVHTTEEEKFDYQPPASRHQTYIQNLKYKEEEVLQTLEDLKEEAKKKKDNDEPEQRQSFFQSLLDQESSRQTMTKDMVKQMSIRYILSLKP